MDDFRELKSMIHALFRVSATHQAEQDLELKPLFLGTTLWSLVWSSDLARRTVVLAE